MAAQDNKFECYEINHADEGPGERGRRMVVSFYYRQPREPAEAAEAAAAEFHEQDARVDDSNCHCHHDGESQVIEVVTEAGPQRFRVRCKVEPQYTAERI